MSQQPVPPPHYPPYPAPQKSNSAKIAFIIGGVIVAVVLIMCAGCGVLFAMSDSDDSTTSSKTRSSKGNTDTHTDDGIATVKLGETVDIKRAYRDGELRVTVKTAAVREPANPIVLPQRGVFLVADIEVEVISGDRSEYVSPALFKLIGPDEVVYESTYSSHEPGLAGVLQAGQKAVGVVAFDVPAEAVSGSKIAFKAYDKDAANWLVP